jgi:hypothetical protein
MARKGQDGSIEITDDVTIEAVKDQDWQKVAEDEAFMNEPVTVMLHTTTDDNAAPYIILSVNNERAPLYRGRPTILKRKFVEVLGRCWETKYKQNELNLQNIAEYNNVRGTSAQAFPFSVLEDKNPRGSMWLSKIMQEAT